MARDSLFRGRGDVVRAIDDWLAAGLIDAATAGRLRAHEAQARPERTGRLAVVAFGFGGLLLAAGVFLFVAANWQELSPAARLAVLLGMVAVLHVGAAFGAGFSEALATTLHAAGTAALGAGILLAGQVFNLQQDWPEGLLLWAIGAGVAVLLLKDWPQVLWLAVLGPGWLVAEWGSRVPVDALYSSRGLAAVMPFGLVLLSTAYLAATAHDRDAPWRRVLARLGAVGLIATATELVGGREFGLDAAAVPSPAVYATGWAFALGVPLVVAAALRGARAWPVLVAAALAAVVTALDAAVTGQRLAIYLAYAAGCVGLVAWGMQERQRLRVNVGVLGFVLTVLAFYFSSLFDMLGRSLGLVGAGLLCIGGGWLAERGRRRLLARLERGAA